MAVIAMFTFASCRKDNAEPQGNKPEIQLDSESAIYTVKVGKELRIEPVYKYVDGNTEYLWTVSGKEVSKTPELVYSSEEAGKYYAAVQVTNSVGSASREMRIDVVDLEIPTVSLNGSSEGFMIEEGSSIDFRPSVSEVTIPVSFRWTVDGSEVSLEKDYTFSSDTPGKYALAFTASTEDGSSDISFEVTVCSKGELPFSWTFAKTEYNMSSGRKIRIAPLFADSKDDAVFTWTVDGNEVQSSGKCEYVFSSSEEGLHEVSVTVRTGSFYSAKNFKVNVCPPEGTYRRNGGASAEVSRVYEFLPAPGQFTNEGYEATTMEEAAAYADERIKGGMYVSLGAFGGYVVMGFDHSIENGGSYDFGIRGNAFNNSSEPGVVWVMQDENGDGLPNDTWYELKGSETGAAGTVQDYAVTYHRPASPDMDIQWTDNMGGSGTVERNQYHRQDYFPAWVEGDSYTLVGTRLESKAYDQSGNGTFWVLPSFGWGYADNFCENDKPEDAKAGYNYFRISDAICFDGTSAELKYIDFVKVHTGVQAMCGWLGETSTEILGAYDLHFGK